MIYSVLFFVFSLLESGIADVISKVKKDLRDFEMKLDPENSKGAQVLLKLLSKEV